jgi:uncharacterized protein YndB with AHSA1/START domain
MREVPSAPDIAVVSGDFLGFSPDELFDHWTSEDKVVAWWPTEAKIDLKLGGEYRFEWPDMDWTLYGVYTSIVLGQRLGFTWNWNHEPDKRSREVEVFFQPIDGGTRMAIYHRPFGDDDQESADRQGVVEGWIHFGMILAGLRSG